MKKTLSEYVSWITSMPFGDLLKEFPGEFVDPTEYEFPSTQATAMLANNNTALMKIINYNKELIANPPAKCHCVSSIGFVKIEDRVHCRSCGCLV